MARQTGNSDGLDEVLGGADVVPTRLGDAVVERLTQAILDGRLKPGDALPSEGRIAAAFGISKQIAREAIRELAAMGVVQIQQGKTTRVRALDAEPLGRIFRFAVRGSETGLVEAIELRRVLEPAVARLAAGRRTAQEVERLRAVLDRLEASLGDVPAWIEADLDFHDEIARMAGNKLMRLQMQALRPVIREVMEAFNSREKRGPADWRATYDRHAAIFAGIAAGSGAAAQRAMTIHFEAADQAIEELFPRPAAATG